MNTPWTGGAKRRFRDYHKRRYGNPLFPGAGRRGPRSSNARAPGAWKRKAIVILVAVGIGTLCWYLFWSPTFRIKTVEITGATAATQGKIAEIIDAQRTKRSLLLFPQSSVFLFDKDAANSAIEAIFHLESLAISKRLPGTLVIEISEIPKRAVLYAGHRFFAMSGTGAVIRELTDREIREIGDMPPDIASTIMQQLGAQMIDVASLAPTEAPEAAKRNGNEFPMLFDDEASAAPEAGPVPGDAIFSEPTLSLILQANTRLPDITGNAVRWFTVREQDEAVDVTMEGDWHLYLTTALPFEVQGGRLALILKEKVGTDRPRLQYVDLRYNERIFFKLRDGSTP